MTLAIGFALLSLLFAGCIDVIFKRYARETRSLGFFLIVSGLAWSLLQGLRMALAGRPVILDPATLIYGTAAGLVVALANVFLLEALKRLDVSQGSTIYRLNSVAVVLLSAWLLGESLGGFKVLGVLCGIAAVLVLYRNDSHKAGSAAHGFHLALAMAIVASLGRAFYGVISKAGLNEGADATTMILIAALCWTATGLGYVVLREKRPRVTPIKLAYSALAGLIVFLIVTTLIEAINRGEVSIVVPIANLSFVVALILSALLGMEAITRRKLGAISLAALAILLLGQAA